MHIPKVRELNDTVTRARQKLTANVMSKFKDLTELVAYVPSFSEAEPEETTSHTAEVPVETLQQSCDLIDALEPYVRDELLNSLCERYLQEYDSKFKKGKEYGSLEQADKRYLWFWKKHKEMRMHFDAAIPFHWRLPKRFAVAFAKRTCTQLRELLGL